MKAFRSMVLGAAVLFAGSVAGAQAAPRVKDDSASARAEGRRWQHGKHKGAERRQQGGPGIGRAAFRGVELTDAQKAQVKTVVERYQPQREALRKQMQDRRASGQKPDSAFRASMQAQHKALMDRQQADIRAVLTAEQRTKFDANVAQMKDRAKQHMGQHGQRGQGRGEGRGQGRGGRQG